MYTREMTIIFLSIYKLTCLIIGFASIYLGYKLFVNGIWGQAGDINASFKDSKIILKKAAPGTFFSFFGASIIVYTIYSGINFREFTMEDSPIPNKSNGQLHFPIQEVYNSFLGNCCKQKKVFSKDTKNEILSSEAVEESLFSQSNPQNNPFNYSSPNFLDDQKFVLPVRNPFKKNKPNIKINGFSAIANNAGVNEDIEPFKKTVDAQISEIYLSNKKALYRLEIDSSGKVMFVKAIPRVMRNLFE